MAQPLGNVVELDIVFQHHRRMGVAEGMETAATEFLFAPHIEVPHVITVHGTAVFTGTDEIAFNIVVAVKTMVLGLLGLIEEQGFLYGLIKRYGPDRRLRLRRRLANGHPLFVIQGTDHGKRAVFHVDMGPLHGQAFADTQTRTIGNHARRIIFMPYREGMENNLYLLM